MFGIIAGAIFAMVLIIHAFTGLFGQSGLSAEAEAEADPDAIEVDRKLSKRSLSTNASTRSAGSTVIYHVPSNSLERVVVGGNRARSESDIEKALPETVRN
jgi:hypothetical protein